MIVIGGTSEDISLFNTKNTASSELSMRLQSSETADMGSRIDLYGFSGEAGDDYQNNITLETNDNPGEGAKIYLKNWLGEQNITLDSDHNGNSRITTDELRIVGENQRTFGMG